MWFSLAWLPVVCENNDNNNNGNYKKICSVVKSRHSGAIQEVIDVHVLHLFMYSLT